LKTNGICNSSPRETQRDVGVPGVTVGFPSLTVDLVAAMLGSVAKPFGIQKVTSHQVESVQAVLDGEVAVPCNPQPAIAGFNSLLRYWLFGKAVG
jgi:hypothetical protein